MALATPGVWFMRCRWPVAARLWFRGLIAMIGCYAAVLALAGLAEVRPNPRSVPHAVLRAALARPI